MFLVLGAKSTASSILIKLQELNEAQIALASKNNELDKVKKELANLTRTAEK